MRREDIRNAIRKVREAKALSYPHLVNLALQTGLMRGHSDYVRFILLGRSRVGSNFLRGLLNSHSRITVFGELFQNYDNIAWALPGYRQSRETLFLFQHDPIRFLETKVFHKFPIGVSAVGFKIFYYHADNSHWRPIWEYLHAQSGLRVIHIKRRNILRTHLSRRKAASSGKWVKLSQSKENDQPITLDYEACLEDFVRTREWEQRFDTFFEDHAKIEVVYEDLSRDYVTEMRRVQEFLGVEYEELVPVTYRQSHQRLSKAIANYHELRERFQGTPWEEFFAE